MSWIPLVWRNNGSYSEKAKYKATRIIISRPIVLWIRENLPKPFKPDTSVMTVFSDAQRLIANLNATPSSQTRYQIYETQIDDAKRKIEKFNQLKAALYGDFADGLLSHQDYTDLSEDYSRRADDLRIFIAELEKEKEKYSAGFGGKMQWALLIEKYKDQESLDAEMAAAFIETLTLFNDGHVEVAFRHRDEIEQVLYVAATRGKEAERYAG